ncbi:MAG: M56 family metallopeptidase [Bacteroidales bacterium]|nr:M56 family metallopeptidase [Bacteroidales bacterium]
MDFVLYILKVNLSLVILYGFYSLLFRQDTFFKLKRIILLSVFLVSLIYPFIDIASTNGVIREAIETGAIPVYTLPEFIVSESGHTNYAFMPNVPEILLTVYLVGVTLLLCWMFIQLGSICLSIRRTEIIRIFNRKIYKSEGLKTPYSFFKWILIDPDRYSETELKEIILHEETHVRQWHSLDMFFSELICILCWFNPFVWLIKREIRINLEYLADRRVLDSGCEATHYQFHLLRLSYHKAAAQLTNNFNVSPLKKRILMMNKKQTSGVGIVKYILFIPIVGILVLSGNCMQAKAGNTSPDAKNSDSSEMLHSSFNTIDEIERDKKESITKDSVDIYPHVENMPQFPGGQRELMKWLGENIKYPDEAATEGIQGIIVARFVVNSDGSISGIEILRKLHPSLDAEAIRVIKEMPKWEPGTNKDGVAVAVYYALPIRFMLSE